jgi:hypothetical protein
MQRSFLRNPGHKLSRGARLVSFGHSNLDGSLHFLKTTSKLRAVERIRPPPGKAWKIVGKASQLGEEVYNMEGAYYDTRGRIVARPETYMFNAPGAVHGGISCNLTLYIHCCSGEPDEIVSVGLMRVVEIRPWAQCQH